MRIAIVLPICNMVKNDSTAKRMENPKSSGAWNIVHSLLRPTTLCDWWTGSNVR
jgi:hypothetical protein